MKLNIKKSLSLALASMSLLLPSVSAVPPETSAPASALISCVDYERLSRFNSDKDVFIHCGEIAEEIYKRCFTGRREWDYNEDGTITVLEFMELEATKEQIDELDNLLVKIKESEDYRENADLYIIFCLTNLYCSNGKDTYAENVAADDWARIFEKCRIKGDAHKKGLDLFNEIFSTRKYREVEFESAVYKDGKMQCVPRKWQWRKIDIGGEIIGCKREYTDLTISFHDLSGRHGRIELGFTIWH